MAGQGSLLSALGGGGGSPINSFIDLYESDVIVNKDGATYFKTGYVDTNVSLYPNASKQTWQLPIVSSSGSTITTGTNVLSDMQFRFGRWIIARNDQASTGSFEILSTTNFDFSPNVSFISNYNENIGTNALRAAPVLVWRSSDSTLFCFVNNRGQRYSTTNGTVWTSSAMTGLNNTKFIQDVLLFGSLWVAIADDGIYSSTDGLAWTLRQAWAVPSIPAGTAKPATLATNGTTILAVADTNIYYTSTNGTTWTSNPVPNNFNTRGWVSFGDSKWIISLRDNRTGSGHTATSINGTTWTVSATPTGLIAPKWHSVLGQWVSGVGRSYSKDGLNWIFATGGLGTYSPISNWVIVSGETYGITFLSSNFFAARSQSLPEVVGLPYSLLNESSQVTVATSGNKYLRVK